MGSALTRRRTKSAPLFAASLLLPGLFAACGGSEEESAPDVAYEVTVTGLESDCSDQGYQKDYTYLLYYDDVSTTQLELKIEGEDGKPESFANGNRSGCRLDYESAVYLEDRSSGLLRWQLTGSAVYEGQAGGCDLDDGVDWLGEETITVVDSEDPDVPVGCTYAMEVQGSFRG
jgi:hypothetical protein